MSELTLWRPQRRGIQLRSLRHTLIALLLLLALVAADSCTVEKDPVAAWIGPNGGELVSADGFLKITIPPGVLPELVKLTLATEPKITGAQLTPTWRVSPGVQWPQPESGKEISAKVTIRYEAPADLADADVIPMHLFGDQLKRVEGAPAFGSQSVTFETPALFGFLLLDWGCGKLCRKTALCENRGIDQNACLSACAAARPDWRRLWCVISSACDAVEFSQDVLQSDCGDVVADGDYDAEEGDATGEELEPEPEPEPDIEPDPEPEQVLDPDPDPDVEPETDPEPDAEPRVWPDPLTCTLDADCDNGGPCFQGFCYSLSLSDVRRYQEDLAGDVYVETAGAPTVSCIGRPLLSDPPPAGPTSVPVRLTVRVLTWKAQSDVQKLSMNVMVYDQAAWLNGGAQPLKQGVTGDDASVLLADVPTNTVLVFEVFRDNDANRIVPSASVGVLLPADMADGATELPLTVFATDSITYTTYSQTVLGRNLPDDGGVVWVSVKDCAGYTIELANTRWTNCEAPGTLYLGSGLDPLTPDWSGMRTGKTGHVIYFDLPSGMHELRVVGRVASNPAHLARQNIPVVPGKVVFVELNRAGWLLPATP